MKIDVWSGPWFNKIASSVDASGRGLNEGPPTAWERTTCEEGIESMLCIMFLWIYL